MEAALLQLLSEIRNQQQLQQAQQLQWQQEFTKALLANSSNLRGKDGAWDEVSRFKTIKVFTGAAAEWEEWFSKVGGTIKARDPQVHEFLQFIERRVAAKDLVDEQYAEKIAEECLMGAEDVRAISSRLHRLLMEITTQDAHAKIRRCKGENGVLGWKRLSLHNNPKTLATGMRDINMAHNPGKVVDPKKLDQAIEAWEDKLSRLRRDPLTEGSTCCSFRHAPRGIPGEGHGSMLC